MIKTSLQDLTCSSPVTGLRLPAAIPDVFSNPAAKAGHEQRSVVPDGWGPASCLQIWEHSGQRTLHTSSSALLMAELVD